MQEQTGSTRNDIKQKTRFIPVTKWSAYHPWPPPGGLRHLIFHAKKNGFQECLIRIGRRVLIDEAAFLEWAKRKGRGR